MGVKQEKSKLCCSRCDAGLVGAPHFQKVSGWMQTRAGGGINQLAMKKKEEIFLCLPCMHLLKAGHDKPHEHQESLL